MPTATEITSQVKADLASRKLTAIDVESRQFAALYDLLTSVESTRDELAKAADWLADKLTRAATTIRAGGSFNPLGEIQGQGSNVDRLCAVLDDRKGEYQRALKLVAAAAADQVSR